MPTRLYSKKVKTVTSQASINGQSSGSVTVVNTNREFGDANLFTVFSFGLTSSVTLPTGVTDPDGAFTGTKVICGGVLLDYTTDEQVDSNVMIFQVQSAARRLNNKSLNTEIFNTTGATVLADVFTKYLGIPSGFYDLSGMGTTGVYGVISGQNAIEECRKIAQASRAILFEDNSGMLIGDSWKDSTSSVDVAIPKQAILSAKKTISTDLSGAPSRIIVRGRYLETTYLDPRTISTESNSTEPAEHAGLDGQDVRTRALAVGIRRRPRTRLPRMQEIRRGQRDRARAMVRQASANLEIRDSNGALEFDGEVALPPSISSIEDRDFDMYSANLPRLEPNEEYTSRVRVTTNAPVVEEVDDPSLVQRNLQQNLNGMQIKQSDLISALTGNKKINRTGKGKNNSKSTDEPDPLRMNLTVVDSDLFDYVGDVEEEIDNQYLSSYEAMFDAAVRRFHEVKTGLIKWTVKTVYLPGVSLNDVVSFVNPENSETVTGVVEAINIPSYSPGEANCTMDLTVGDFRNLGSTVYAGGSLIFNGNLVATGGGGWSSNGSVKLVGNFAAFLAGGVLSQTIPLEVGAGYIVTVVFTNGTVVISAASSTTNGTGTVSLSFTAGVSSTLLSLSSTTGGYLKSVFLTKNVTR